MLKTVFAVGLLLGLSTAALADKALTALTDCWTKAAEGGKGPPKVVAAAASRACTAEIAEAEKTNDAIVIAGELNVLRDKFIAGRDDITGAIRVAPKR